MENWWVYKGIDEQHEEELPAPPQWRTFNEEAEAKFLDSSGKPISADRLAQEKSSTVSWKQSRGIGFQVNDDEIRLINAALLLRRPLFVTGKPGTGKSTLAYAVAHELKLGEVLHWPITTRVTLKDGLYHYDALGRLEVASSEKNQHPENDSYKNIGKFIHLGPLGTALLPTKKPRVLLIDEIDKGDIDLPNDLLNIFEEGEFRIPELERISERIEEVSVRVHSETTGSRMVNIRAGHVRCNAFPFIVLTSNGERDFPPAFLRRCIRLHLNLPDANALTQIVQARLKIKEDEKIQRLINTFADLLKEGNRATDQLLNAVYLVTKANVTSEAFLNILQEPLTSTGFDKD